jgi:hypothetical protein
LPFIEGLDPRTDLKVLTYTMQKQQELEGSVDRLRGSFNKLKRRKPYKNIWIGGFYGIHPLCTPNGWHVHGHCLIESDYIKHAQLLSDWKKVTKGEGKIIHINRTNNPRETLRYILKPLREKPILYGREAEYHRCLYRKRLFQGFGTWYKRSSRLKPKPRCRECRSNELVYPQHQINPNFG